MTKRGPVAHDGWEPGTALVTRRSVTMSQTAVRPAERRPAEERFLLPSFDDVYRRESVAMVRMAVLLVGSHELAEEIVQDAFAQLYERWNRVDRPGAYLRTCVVNGCRRAHRRRRLGDRAVAGAPRPLPAELGADHLADALAALPARRRAAVVLRYYQDLSEAEIAEALGVRPGTVKSLLHRGLAQLRQAVEQ
jgi:RNA polymerase sigma-70 factor (sigma-E family)